MILMKRLAAGVSAGALALGLGACSAVSEDSSSTDGGGDGLTVATSFYPLAWMVEQVGGDDVTVTSMTPSNVEPHDYELSPADIAKMNEADVVVYVEGFQPSMDDAVDSLTGPEVLELSGAVGLLPLDEEVADAHGDDDEGSNHGDLDPHFWLDPIRMRETSEYIEEALSAADADHKATFEQNQDAVYTKLSDLDSSYKSGLATCERQTVVTTHAAFGYLTSRYGLTQVAISGIDPEAEPSPADLAAIKKTIKQTGTTTVFAEELASPKTAEAVAEETGADLQVLNPLESQPAEGDYISGMDSNLSTLRTALSCQ